MGQLSLRTSTLIVLSGILALGTVGCSNNNLVIPKGDAADTLPSSAAPSVSPKSPPSKSPKAPTARDLYVQATDIGAGAILIGESALVREDWSLAANRWQEAVRLLKAIPSSSNQYAAAQKKLKDYQNHLTLAKTKVTPPPQKSCSGDTNPPFFFAPIKNRIGSVPVIEVSFADGHKFDMAVDTGASHSLVTQSMAATLQLPIVGMGIATIANGSSMMISSGLLKFAEIDGRVMRDVPVAIAPSKMELGLLGQDFFKGYDVIIKEGVVEFRRQPGVRTITKAASSSKFCPVDTNPQFFSVPIKRREDGLPIVAVSFNNQRQFDMIFDTGATSTLVTRQMAAQLNLPLVGARRAQIADGSFVTFPTALVKSQKMKTRTQTDVVVSVAPPAMRIGLLGQDFFKGYNVTIKRNVIEFRRQRYGS